MLNFKLSLKSELFKDITEMELIALGRCLKMRVKTFNKNEFIVTENSPFNDILVILKGKAVEKTFNNNNDSILRVLTMGDVFGAYECGLMQSVFSTNLETKTACTVLLLNAKNLMNPCSNLCNRHLKIKNNLIRILAKQNKDLNDKMIILGKRTTKEKILFYLKKIQAENNSSYFDVPFSRQQLADYLNVDRSALSIVLSNLKKNNILDFSKNHFHLKI